jgi:hypothetical protein
MLRLIAFLVLAAPAWAEPVGTLGELPVELEGEFGEMKLKVGGAEMLTDYLLEVAGIEDVGGTPTLVGFAFSGGNVCEGSNFVIALIEGKPQLWGPIDVCGPTQFEPFAGGLRFFTEAMPGSEGQSWLWTPAGGMVEGPPVAFAPDPALGWAELAAEMPSHPFDILYYAEIAAQIDTVLGADRATFMERIEGLGSGEMRGEDFFGEACVKLTCEEDAAMMYLDASEKRAFLAWTVAGAGEPFLAPPETEWSEEARAAYLAWLTN